MRKKEEDMVGVTSFVMATALFGAVVSNGTTQTIERGVKSRSEVKLSLTATKSEYAVFEPVMVTVGLTNVSKDLLVVKGSLPVTNGQVRLLITDPNGVEQQYHPGAFTDVIGDQMRLTPGKVEESREIIFWSGLRRELAFGAPGKYEIEATFWLSLGGTGETIHSPKLSLTISEPSADDRLFIERIGSKQMLMDMFTTGPSMYCKEQSPAACVENMLSIAREVSGSAYSPYLMFYIGEAIEGEVIEVQPRNERAGDVYSELLKRWPKHELGFVTDSYLGRTMVKSGKKKEAAEHFRMMEGKYPRMKETIERFQDASGRGDDQD